MQTICYKSKTLIQTFNKKINNFKVNLLKDIRTLNHKINFKIHSFFKINNKVQTNKNFHINLKNNNRILIKEKASLQIKIKTKCSIKINNN